MKRMPNTCPSCERMLMVTQLKCPRCGTTIDGEFNLSNLMRLSQEQQKFLLVFLKCRGSIKDIEKELGVSYPTVRNKLDDLLIALGFMESAGKINEEVVMRRKEVLDKIEKGEIKVAEAVKMFREK